MKDDDERLCEPAGIEQTKPGGDSFRRRKALAASVAIVASAFLSASATGQTTTLPNDLIEADYLNFVLNIHYLQASLYSGAIRGEFLSSTTLGLSPVRPVERNTAAINITDPVLRAFLAEMLDTELAHINTTRDRLDASFLGTPPSVIRTIVAPALTLNVTATLDDGFSRVFGSLVREYYGRAFQLYGIEEDYLIAISHIKDIAVSAYQGVAALQSDQGIRDRFAGIMATQAIQAAILRDMILDRSRQAGSRLSEITTRLATARSSADPATVFTDQGIERTSTAAGFATNIVPADTRGLGQPRTPLQVLLVLVGRPQPFVDGLFFPQGFNGRINLSLFGIR